MVRSHVVHRGVALFALLLFSGSAAAVCHPRHFCARWRGTMTSSDGAVGVVNAHGVHIVLCTHDLGPGYVGRFHCRGTACLGRHGRFAFTNLSPSLAQGSLLRAHHRDQGCDFRDEAASDLTIDTGYSCYAPGPAGETLVSEGNLRLEGRRVACP